MIITFSPFSKPHIPFFIILPYIQICCLLLQYIHLVLIVHLFASLIDPVLCCTATEACYVQMACQSQFILVEYILGPYTIK